MSSPRAAAELLSDGGRAAASDDFFRSTTFLEVEGTTHSLVVSTPGSQVAIPLVVRSIPGSDRQDAVSPYGFPGGTRTGPPLHQREIDFSGTGLVSLFLRDRASDAVLLGGTARSRLHVYDPAHPRTLGSTFARHVRRNVREGYTVQLIAGDDVDDDTLEGFRGCYVETMVRNEAGERYFFSTSYLRACLDFPRSWMVAAYAPDRSYASGMIVAESDGMLHYFLGGTAEAHRAASPAKNCFVRVMDLAEELATPLNLGGGVTPGDGLDRFKQSFSNAGSDYTTHEIVADEGSYAALAPEGDPCESFFPSYRA